MRSAGVRTVRIEVPWRDIEPVPGDLSRLERYDRIVLTFARHGLGVLPVVHTTPAWAAAGGSREPGAIPADPRTYAAFLATLVRRYGRRGSLWAANPGARAVPIRSWQVWNEPNHTPFWQGDPWETTYLRLLRVARRAVKAADPRAEVVLGGLTNLSWEGLLRLYRAGAKGSFDVAAIHAFSRTVPNIGVLTRLARIVMRRHGDRRPLMITELTWSSGRGHSTRNYGWETTEAGQAARLRATLRLLARLRRPQGLRSVHWYSWLSPPIGDPWSFAYSGLRRQSAEGIVDKPALGAFRATVRELRRR